MPDLLSEGAFAGSNCEVLEPLNRFEPEKLPNKQLYHNSPLYGSRVEQLVSELDGALYGAQKPNLAIQHEKAEHRLVLILKLKGLSNREIARRIGFTEPWVSQITRQPWFQVQLVEELSHVQEEVVDQILKVEATNSLFKLVELRDTAKSEMVQKDCAIDILNRHLGKAVQRTEIRGSVQHSLVRAENIDNELADIEREERRLLSMGTDRGEDTGPLRPGASSSDPSLNEVTNPIAMDLMEDLRDV